MKTSETDFKLIDKDSQENVSGLARIFPLLVSVDYHIARGKFGIFRSDHEKVKFIRDTQSAVHIW